MGKQKSIIVGTFGPAYPSAEGNVPQAYLGNKIWYSPERKFFLITDDNNKARSRSFDMTRFRAFIDQGAIVFSSASVEAYMTQLLEEYEAEQAAAMADMYEAVVDYDGYGQAGYDGYGDASGEYDGGYLAADGYDGGDDGGYDGGYGQAYPDADPAYNELPADQVPSRRRSNRQDDHKRNLTDAKAISHKDPTRHLGVFMALTLVFAIIAVVVINFGEPIIQAVAPLLS